MRCTQQSQHLSLKGYRVSPGEPELEKEPFWREGLTEVDDFKAVRLQRETLVRCMQTHLREHYGHTKTENSS